MKTLEQKRAEAALKRVSELDAQSDGFKRRYRAYVERLCPTIVMNGLGQALATEWAAAGARKTEEERAHYELCLSVKDWLCREGGVYDPASSPGELLKFITENDEKSYLRAQAEALAWLVWHKKFCRARFPIGEGE